MRNGHRQALTKGVKKMTKVFWGLFIIDGVEDEYAVVVLPGHTIEQAIEETIQIFEKSTHKKVEFDGFTEPLR